MCSDTRVLARVRRASVVTELVKNNDDVCGSCFHTLNVNGRRIERLVVKREIGVVVRGGIGEAKRYSLVPVPRSNSSCWRPGLTAVIGSNSRNWCRRRRRRCCRCPPTPRAARTSARLTVMNAVDDRVLFWSLVVTDDRVLSGHYWSAIAAVTRFHSRRSLSLLTDQATQCTDQRPPAPHRAADIFMHEYDVIRPPQFHLPV